MINDKLVCVVKNLSGKTQRVPVIWGKDNVGKGKTFECLKKDAEALLRMYSGMFDIVETKTINVKGEGTEVFIAKPTEKKVETKVEPTDELLEARKEYETKLEKDVPTNKKNDLEWLKNKVKAL